MANERRLIDLNELGIGRCNPDAFPLNNRGYCAGWNGVIALLEKAPTVDAVEVIFCKDCKHATELGETEKKIYLDECMICTSGDATIDGYNIVMPEHFCSYGERRCE